LKEFVIRAVFALYGRGVFLVSFSSFWTCCCKVWPIYLLKEEKRQTKCRLLCFPEDSLDPLTNVVCSPVSTDGEIENEIERLPFKSAFKIRDHEFSSTTARICWKVSSMEIKKRVVKSSSDSNEAAAQLLSRLSVVNN
jgi:hypothetical protein